MPSTPTAQPSLHILLLTDRDWMHPQAGGTGTNLFGQVARWLAWGHQVTVVAGDYPGAARYERPSERLQIHRMGTRLTVFPRAAWAVSRGLGADADVILEVINGIAFFTPLWPRLRPARVALCHHVHQEHYVAELGLQGRLAALVLERLPLRYLYRRTPFLTISNAARNDLVALGVPAENIHVAYLGVEPSQFRELPKASRPTLLYLGRLKQYKRIEVVLDVLEAIPEAHLDIAGDGDHRLALEAEIDRRHLRERVTLHGHVSNERKLELYARAWVSLTASSAEGWGLTVMEAAACSTPSAALRIGGLPEAIVDGVTGALAEDPGELAERVREILHSPELRRRLGEAACARARGFSWDHVAAANLAVLQTAAESSAPRVAKRVRPPRTHPAAQLVLMSLAGGTARGRRAVVEPQFERAKAAWSDIEGWLTVEQAQRLWNAARAVRPPARMVEIGSFRGRSTIVLALAATDGVGLVTIDPHLGNDRGPQQIRPSAELGQADYEVFLANLRRAAVSGRVRHVRRRSREALTEVDGDLQLLYVDGAHRYPDALGDIERWGARVAPGGRLLVHDAFSSVGVTLALLRSVVGRRQWRYLGRSGSLAEYERAECGPLERWLGALPATANLAWFVRNLAVKALIVLRLRPLTRLLGHHDGPWPY